MSRKTQNTAAASVVSQESSVSPETNLPQNDDNGAVKSETENETVADVTTLPVAKKRSERVAKAPINIMRVVSDDAVKATKESDSANWNLATSIAAAVLYTASVRAKAGETFPADTKDASKLPPRLRECITATVYAVECAVAYSGLMVYLDTGSDVARIAAMPNGSIVERSVDGERKRVPDADRMAKRKAAAEYVSAKYVWREPKRLESGGFEFVNNADGIPVPVVDLSTPARVLPVKVTKEQADAHYPGYKPVARVNSLAQGRKHGAAIVAWFFKNRRSFITDLDGRKMTADDLEMVRNIVRDNIADTFAGLETAYKLGRPATRKPAPLVEKLTKDGNKEVEKLSISDLARLATFFDQLHKRRVANANAADEAVSDAFDSFESDDYEDSAAA